MDKKLEQRVEELEMKVAVLEGQVPAQPDINEIVKKITEGICTVEID